MYVLAVNCGSSSIKAAVIDSQQWRRVLDVRIDEIGKPACHRRTAGETQTLGAATDQRTAIEIVLDDVEPSLRSHPGSAIVHRIVHGGEQFVQPVLIDEEVLAGLDASSELAPLHNPPALAAVRASRARFGDIPHVATFDTAFHSTLPPRAREYALPADVRSRFGIRRFGFHGLNHSHVMHSVSNYLRRPAQELRIVSCHLGNGASMAAIEYGHSVDTSMGMTPIEGLVMGSRAGDIDPGVPLALLRAGWTIDQLEDLLQRRAGLQGLTGTNDMDEIERRAATGDDSCHLAMLVYSHRIRKYLGAYAAVMGGLDAIAFTAGVGENSPAIRERCLHRLEFLGVVIDDDRNRNATVEEEVCTEISVPDSATRVLVVRADEETAMARDAVRLLLDRSISRLPGEGGDASGS